MPVIEKGTQIGLDGKRYPVGDPRLSVRPGGSSSVPAPIDVEGVRTVVVTERGSHYLSAMAPVAVAQGLAHSWVVPVPADAIPLPMKVMVISHVGVKPELAEVSVEAQKVSSGAGDLDEDSVLVRSWAVNPVLTQDEEDPTVWHVQMTNHSGSASAIEAGDDQMAYLEPGWFRASISVRWGA